MKPQPLIAACAFICAACLVPFDCVPFARAAELVTLSNGFQMQCDRHVTAGGSVRIYLTAGNDNYIDLPPSAIASVSQIATPVTPPISNPAVGLPQPASLSATPDPAPQQVAEKLSTEGGGGFNSRTSRAMSAGFSPGVRSAASQAALTPADLRQMLDKAGRTHNLDVDLLASIVHAESGGNPLAVSRAGARGLMQLMPATAATLGVRNSFQPQQNVSGGSAYLDALLTRYSDNLALALAAYNAGPEAVDRYRGIPPYPETRAYVARVIHEFNRRVLLRRAAARQPLTHKLHEAIAQK